jgi:hypothetical protein
MDPASNTNVYSSPFTDLNCSLTVDLVIRVYSGLPFELFPENLAMYIGKKRIGL